MSNMSYCIFENTDSDLEDCLDHINDTELSDTENTARAELVMKCHDIINTYDEDLNA